MPGWPSRRGRRRGALMTPLKMHADEVHTDASLVRRLLTAQFPQ